MPRPHFDFVSLCINIIQKSSIIYHVHLCASTVATKWSIFGLIDSGWAKHIGCSKTDTEYWGVNFFFTVDACTFPAKFVGNLQIAAFPVKFQ